MIRRSWFLVPSLLSLVLCLWLFGLAPKTQGQEIKDKEARPKDEPAFLVNPYLQLPSPNNMTVMWETNRKLPSRVEFGTTRDLGQVAEIKMPTILHEVALHDLQVGTSYFYRVRSGELVSDVYTFKTAPPLGTKRWRMAVYGDSRSNPATHRKVVEQIAKAKVDLIVHTGDIVANGKNHDSWRKEFFEPLSPLAHSVPWVSTIGNHERDADNYFSYMTLPGNERYFGFDYANAHIICLDSNGWIEKGRDSQQFQWLTSHLRHRRATTWTFVAFHHPLFSAHATRPINSLRWDWAPVFLDPDNHVDGVLTGHDHFYARNYRMGRLGERPQPGVFFLTTAGGGASLYRTKARDYVAKEKSIHHFTLFDFDGDKITITAIDLTGKMIDRYVLTKEPTPPDEYCVYEIEELRQFLRLALAAAPAVALEERSPAGSRLNNVVTIDTRLRVPTRFRVPVSGRLVWQSVPGWQLKQPEVPFHLQPGQALDIPLQALVKPGPFPKTPALAIAFELGKFRNRAIEVFPFKLAGPESVRVRRAATAPVIDGKLDEESWTFAKPGDGPSSFYSLLGLPPRGGRSDHIQFLVDKDWLYVGARLDDPLASVQVKRRNPDADTSRLVLSGEHLRVVLSDGKETRTFAVSPEQIRYSGIGQKEDKRVTWKAFASGQQDTWCVEMAIPRRLFPGVENLRINVVHRHQDGKQFIDYELCPTYGMGSNPDLLPDWKPREAVDRFARLLMD